jgi:hypothetical protein
MGGRLVSLEHRRFIRLLAVADNEATHVGPQTTKRP